MPFAANVVELSFIGATQFHAIKPRSSFSHKDGGGAVVTRSRYFWQR